MKRPLIVIVVLGLAGSLARTATPLFISGDVPTTESATASTLLPSQAFRYATPVSYALALTVPGNPTLDGVEKMDGPGDWLFSVESANDLAGALGGVDAEPRDVIRFDGSAGAFSVFFCGAAAGVPLDVNVDALYLDGGDTGDLIVSFDVAVTLGSFAFEPADLVRYLRTAPGCAGWSLAAVNPDFDASAAGIGIQTAVNLIGADEIGPQRILSFDVPVSLGPPGIVDYVPGRIVSWNGSAFALFESLSGWPPSSAVDGLSTLGNAGIVPPTITLTRTGPFDTSNLILNWIGSCSEGASSYGVYEGSLGSWSSHTLKDCDDSGVPLTEQITPEAGARYYLVVPRNTMIEGSYGRRRNNAPLSFVERPVGIAQCVAPQVLTPCPP